MGMNDDQETILTNGEPVHEGFDELKPNGQQKAYVILTEEERAKGFVRPVRTDYIHKGIRPQYPTRELTPEEHERYDQFGYVLFERYPDEMLPKTGSFWTKEQLESGCGGVTTMSRAIAETYARDPKFYGGTFCVHCGRHFPVAEFVWADDGEVVGS